MDPNPNTGHVFLLHCDAENLAADAILVPGKPVHTSGVVAIESPDSRVKVFEAPIVASSVDLDDLLSQAKEVVQGFLDAATTAVDGSQFRRAKPLLALPVFGVGRMDPNDLIHEEGAIISVVLPMLYEHVNKNNVDVALCTIDISAYNVMQVQRENLCPIKGGPFWMLDEQTKKCAERLADDALRGSLTLFFGAGASYPSGLPSWGGLLEDLAVKAGFTEEERKGLKDLDFLDQPTLIEAKMGMEFRQEIAKSVQGGRYTPTHAILAELRVPSATTNYDDLFEAAAASHKDDDASEGVILSLPWNSDKVRDQGAKTARSLLKLHGCVSHPESIVLTREDYMRYEDDRRALRGVVQEMLITSNMLFVGFSMTDENLHKIIDEVREGLGRKKDEKRDKLGTITALLENKMFTQLWGQDFHVTTFGKSWGDNPAWVHDCFFDYMGTLVASRKARCSFILNPKFSRLLSEEEKRIAEALAPLVEISSDPKIQSAEAWNDVQKLLSLLGAPE